MYAYIKDFSIIYKSDEKEYIDHDIVYTTEYDVTDRLIFEEGTIKRYEDSRQYKIDKNILTLQEENELLRRQKDQIQTEQDKFLNDFQRLKAKQYFISNVGKDA